VDVDNTATLSGVTLFDPETEAAGVWVLRTGAVKLLAAAWDGSQRIVRVLTSGDVAGLEALLAGAYTHTAVTVGEVRACRIPLPAIKQLCLEHPEFQWNLMGNLQSALNETEQWLLDLASTGVNARVRMARLLLRLRVGDSNRIRSFSREELGLMLGITTETASRIIAAFIREKFLARAETGGRFFTGDVAALTRIAQEK
jgi:CRP-like cAMP-binding protein